MSEGRVFKFKSIDGKDIFVKEWEVHNPKGVVQIVHGLGETAEYYEEFAEELVKNRYSVYLNEERGQGRTGGTEFAGDAGDDAFNFMVEDLYELLKYIKDKNSNVPIFLVGHSLGTLIAKLFMKKYGTYIDGVVLTGVPWIENVDEMIESIDIEIEKRGKKFPSKETYKRLFEHVNDDFQPSRTNLEWITSDDNKIKQILSSPYTNTLFNNNFYKDFLSVVKEVQDEKFIDNFSKDKPVMLLCGSDDSMNRHGKMVEKEYELFIHKGFKNITYKIYDNMRHSILQEKQRSIVFNDIIEWLDIKS